jgi:hypothetical protein
MQSQGLPGFERVLAERERRRQRAERIRALALVREIQRAERIIRAFGENFEFETAPRALDGIAATLQRKIDNWQTRER